jgi:hypothetical protein
MRPSGSLARGACDLILLHFATLRLQGCFDWWGYTNGDYALKSGVQMSAVWSMVQTLASGSR